MDEIKAGRVVRNAAGWRGRVIEEHIPEDRVLTGAERLFVVYWILDAANRWAPKSRALAFAGDLTPTTEDALTNGLARRAA